jgi:hypothetical protein
MGGGWANAVWENKLYEADPSWTYIGCHRDDGNRDLPEGPHEYGFVPASCREACEDYPFFSLQNGGWCACGHKYGVPEATYPAIDESECNTVGGFMQGGGWANAVFSNNDYIERDLKTYGDEGVYTPALGDEPQQQLIRVGNFWYKTFEIVCNSDVYILLSQGPDMQGAVYEIKLGADGTGSIRKDMVSEW